MGLKLDKSAREDIHGVYCINHLDACKKISVNHEQEAVDL